jgi:hypothetical protein
MFRMPDGHTSTRNFQLTIYRPVLSRHAVRQFSQFIRTHSLFSSTSLNNRHLQPSCGVFLQNRIEFLKALQISSAHRSVKSQTEHSDWFVLRHKWIYSCRTNLTKSSKNNGSVFLTLIKCHSIKTCAGQVISIHNLSTILRLWCCVELSFLGFRSKWTLFSGLMKITPRLVPLTNIN